MDDYRPRTIDDVQEAVQVLMSAYCNRQVSLADPLDSLGLDEMEQAALHHNLEEIYAIEIGDDEFYMAASVGALAQDIYLLTEQAAK